VTVSVTRATTASGAIYEFLPDLSRVRRVSSQAAPSAFPHGEDSFIFESLRRDDEWVRIIEHCGVKSPISLDVIREGYPLIITMEALGEGAGTTRYTTPVTSVTTHEMDDCEI